MSEAVRFNGEAIELVVDFGMASTFEMDVEQAVAMTPAALTPVELRPGVALASLVFFRFTTGNAHPGFGPLPAYFELVFGIHVAPYLTWGVSKFALYVVNIGTDLPAAGEFLRTVHHMPVFAGSLKAQVDAERAQITVSDGSAPIAEMKNLHPAPVFAPDALAAHVFALDEGRIWGYPEVLSGPMLRHQTRGKAVTLSRHPFFAGVTLPAQPASYMQAVGAPGARTLQVAYRAVALPDRTR